MHLIPRLMRTYRVFAIRSIHTAKLLPLRRSCNTVYTLHDTVQSRVCTNGHISPTEIIINRTNLKQKGDQRVKTIVSSF